MYLWDGQTGEIVKFQANGESAKADAKKRMSGNYSGRKVELKAIE
jgi:hypothetical protein